MSKLAKNEVVWKTSDEGFKLKSKMDQRRLIMKNNLEKSNIEIARLIQESEPTTKLKSLEMWVGRSKAFYKN